MDIHQNRGSIKFEEDGADEGVADSGGIAVASAAVTETYGSPVEIIAATARQAQGIIVFGGPRAIITGFGAHIKVLVGASTVEKDKVEAMLCRTQGDEQQADAFYCPISIPKGTRLSVAVADDSSAARDCDISIVVLSGGPWPGSALTHSEGDGAVTQGFGHPIDPGASANTKGTPWVEMIAATAFHWRKMMVIFDQNSATMGDDQWLMDIGIGAASSEKVKIPNLRAACGSSDDVMTPRVVGTFDCDFPVGTRISARSQSSDVTSGPRTIRLTLVGFG